jgi:hypothetical protein
VIDWKNDVSELPVADEALFIVVVVVGDAIDMIAATRE